MHLWNGALQGANIASASSITLPNDGNYHHITGTATIAGIAASGRGIGAIETWVFDGAAPLTNSGTFILAGGANYTPAVGSVVQFVHEGSGTWRECFRTRFDGNAAHYLDGTGGFSTPAGTGGDMVRIASTLLGSATADITFSSIPGTYKHLLVVGQLRGDNASTQNTVCQINGDTGTNYAWQTMYAQSLSSDAGTGATYAKVGNVPGSGATAGQAAPLNVSFPNYAGTTFRKGYTAQSNSPSQPLIMIHSGEWASTSAINALKFYATAGNLDTGSILTLYGLN